MESHELHVSLSCLDSRRLGNGSEPLQMPAVASFKELQNQRIPRPEHGIGSSTCTMSCSEAG